MREAISSATSRSREVLTEEYSVALGGYLAGAGETALRRAYEFGRTALVNGTGLLDMAIVHHDALEKTLPGVSSHREKPEALREAGQFLAESLSPFEMAYRGFKDANSALQHFNEVLEQEAKRIAHLLHDEAGQLLFAVHLALADLGRDMDPALQERFQKVTSLLTQVEERMRELSHELRPTVLDDLGLVPALENLARGVSRRNGIPIVVRSSLQGRLPPKIETAVYRIVQEAVTNAMKHSQATQVDVALEQIGQILTCAVRDNGVGFDADSVFSGKAQRGLGLIGIRERLDLLGGTLEIRSTTGKGTGLQVKIPCEV
jgi:signal transduction histidine kinase